MKKFSGFLIFIMILATFFSCASTEGNTGGGDTNMEVDTPPTAADTNGDAGADYLSLDQAIQQAADDISEKLSAGTRVSIVAFESESENLSDYIMDELSGALVDSSLEVADRRNLPYIFKELDFQMSGFVSDETALSVGKFLGAQLVITGQFVNAGGRYRCRVSSISAETAVHATSTRLDVRNDKQLKDMLASLKNNVLVSKAAGYGTAPPKTAGTFLDRGILFASRGEFEMAIEDFTEAIKLNPNLESAYILRGNALFASVSFVTDIGENFSYFDSISIAGRKLTEAAKREYDKAIENFTRAIKLNPENAEAYRWRGISYNDKNDYDRALSDYTQAGAPIFSVRLFCEAKNRAFRFNLLAMPKGFTLQSLARPKGFR